VSEKELQQQKQRKDAPIFAGLMQKSDQKLPNYDDDTQETFGKWKSRMRKNLT